MERIEKLEADRMEWALKTFPEATAESSLEKLKSEIKEVEELLSLGVGFFVEIPELSEEYADCLMCLFDSAGRVGISAGVVIDAFEKKLAKNKARVWEKNPDNTYSHVKNPFA